MSRPTAPPSYAEATDHGIYPGNSGYPLPGSYSPSRTPGNMAYPPLGNMSYPGNVTHPPGERPGYPPMGFPIPPTIPLNPTWTGPVSGPYGSSEPSPHPGSEGFSASSWSDITVRHAFIRKVYLILTAQLSVTVGIVAAFTFSEPLQQFVRKYSALYWAAYGIFIVIYIVLVCCEGPRRRFPWNVILLTIFTLAMSYLTGTIASYYSTKSVFMCLGITTLVCLGITLFCVQTKVDFTSCTGLFCALGIGLFVAGIIISVTLSFKYMPWLHSLYAAAAAIIFTLFLAYDTQLILGNRKHSISPEEYVYASLRLYTDIVQIFLNLLQLFGSRD